MYDPDILFMDGRTRGGMAPQILTDHLPYYNQGKCYAHHSTTGIHNFFDLPLPSLIFYIKVVKMKCLLYLFVCAGVWAL